MELFHKKVKVTKGGGSGNSFKVTIPIEMAQELGITLENYVQWSFCIKKDGEKYLKLIKYPTDEEKQ